MNVISLIGDKKQILNTDTISAIGMMKDHVRTFLKENGGYENGYETSFDVIVRRNVFSGVEWCTPKQGALTKNQINELGSKIYSILHEILIHTSLEEVSFYSSHTEHGCYKIYISVTFEVEICL